MRRKDAIDYVAFVVDDAGSGRELGADPHAIIREHDPEILENYDHTFGLGFAHPSRLVGWQCGFEPLFVAVHSYLDVILPDEEAEDMAKEFLLERDWFGASPRDADYIL